MHINRVHFRNILTAVFLLGFSLISYALDIYDFKEPKDPKLDIAVAIKGGDFRFYAVNGFASGMVPGTDQYRADKEIIQLYGTQTIAGTTDAFESDNHAELIKRAWEYASAYNKLLLEYLRGPGNKKPNTQTPK